MGRESEWSHYTAVTSHSFSLLSNQVSSNNKSITATMLLCHPPVVTQCSRFHIRERAERRKNKIKTHLPVVTIPLHCREKTRRRLVQSAGLLAKKQWKQPGRGSGRCECVVSESSRAEFGERGEACCFVFFFPLSSLTEYGKSDSSEARTLTERRALMQVGRPWLLQKQEKRERRENQRSLPWPTYVTP